MIWLEDIRKDWQGQLSIDNLFISEALVKRHGWKCLRVIKDPEFRRKSWILVQVDKGSL